MKKRWMMLLLAGVAAVMMTGCGGGGGYDAGYDDGYSDGVSDDPQLTTLFLIDDNTGLGADHVPYTCYAPDGSVSENGYTTSSGAFTFVPGERCVFDLFGFNGTVPVYAQPLYIADDLDDGKEDIAYSCHNDTDVVEGTTDFFGYFEYPIDAICKFYF